MTTAPAYNVVTYNTGRVYTESPEEQGLGTGPRLLRLFVDPVEAQRYRDTVQVYLGERLQVRVSTLREIRQNARRVRQGCRIEICKMEENEWPTRLASLPPGPVYVN